MRHIACRWFVISSLVLAETAVWGANRPQYGGTLHVSTRAALASLAPSDAAQAGSVSSNNILALIFDTLTTMDENGRVHPGLATSWRANPGNQRWRFQLRHGVKFHDGTSLTAEIVASSLRGANPSWSVSTDGDSVVVEKDSADPELAAELALPQNAIAKANSDRPGGTGPYHVVDFQAGKKLTLTANEDYWGGRPFLDSIEVEMGRSFRDQMTALELGRVDVVEVAPEQVHRFALDRSQLANSQPTELLALVFAQEAKTPDERSLRETLALSIDRGSMRSVLLQGAGQPAGGLLPNWISGYSFVFPTDADLPRARQQRSQIRAVQSWTLGYDAADGLARLMAERIALNAKDAGLSLQPTSNATADLRLLRITLNSPDAWISLAEIATATALPMGRTLGGSPEELNKAEQSLLNTRKVIPLFHLPITYAASRGLRNWAARADGGWNLADAWLEVPRP